MQKLMSELEPFAGAEVPAPVPVVTTAIAVAGMLTLVPVAPPGIVRSGAIIGRGQLPGR